MLPAILPRPPRPSGGDVLRAILPGPAVPGLAAGRAVSPAIHPWPPCCPGRGTCRQRFSRGRLVVPEGRAAGGPPAQAAPVLVRREGRPVGDPPAAASSFGRDVLLSILPPEWCLASSAGRDVPPAILPRLPPRLEGTCCWRSSCPRLDCGCDQTTVEIRF